MGPIRFANLFGILTSPGAVRRTSTRVPSDTYNSYLVLLLVCISMIIQHITILRNGNIIANSAIRRWANGIRAREYLRVSLLLSTNVLNERLITYLCDNRTKKFFKNKSVEEKPCNYYNITLITNDIYSNPLFYV